MALPGSGRTERREQLTLAIRAQARPPRPVKALFPLPGQHVGLEFGPGPVPQSGGRRGPGRCGRKSPPSRARRPTSAATRAHVLGHALAEQPGRVRLDDRPDVPAEPPGLLDPAAERDDRADRVDVPVVPACAQSSSQAARSQASTTCVGMSGVAGTSIAPRGSRAARATQ
jgi:hypothetical protein